MCFLLGLKPYLTTAYHPQANEQTERFNKTIAQCLRHYVEENRPDWDLYVQPLTYAYTMQVHKSTGTTPFDLILSRHPQLILVQSHSSAVSQSVPENISVAHLKKVTLRRLQNAVAIEKLISPQRDLDTKRTSTER